MVLEGLTVTPYIKVGNRSRMAYSLRWTGLVAPGHRAEPGKAGSHLRDGPQGGRVPDPGPRGRRQDVDPWR